VPLLQAHDQRDIDGGGVMKVKVRIQGDTFQDCERLRQRFLKKHPELILGKPRKGANPKYEGRQKWASYGDFQYGVIRKRRS